MQLLPHTMLLDHFREVSLYYLATEPGHVVNSLTLYQPMTANAVMTFVNSP